jgi:hypothetical protein
VSNPIDFINVVLVFNVNPGEKRMMLSSNNLRTYAVEKGMMVWWGGFTIPPHPHTPPKCVTQKSIRFDQIYRVNPNNQLGDFA